MRRILVIAAITLVSSTSATFAEAQTRATAKAHPRAAIPTKAVALSDDALDKVTAGTISANTSEGVVKFQGQAQTAKGLVSSTGSLAVQSGGVNNTNVGIISINGNAQQNLSSLINLNAVNSKINVLMNLNVNINSTVGTLTQSNLNGKP
jgi:hypothetical protein